MKVSVIGAGHGGQAIAGYIAYKGFKTILYNRNKSVIEEIKENNGINISGYINTKITDITLSNCLKSTLKESELIMISIPANAHEDLASKMASYVTDNHIIVINPGRTLGAYYFKKYLKTYGCKSNPIIAETDTFILTSRKVRNGFSDIMSLKKEVYIAADTVENTEKVYNLLIQPFPMIKKATTYIYTSFSNIGAIFHPIPAIFNIGRIENKNRYLHYKEGITPSICNIMEKLDAERVYLAKKLGENVPSAKEWLENVYGSKGSGLYEALQNTEAYNKVLAPSEISTRYIYEDITTGIVPMYCIAKEIGAKCDILELIIMIASQMFDYDFINNGRKDIMGFIKTLEI